MSASLSIFDLLCLMIPLCGIWYNTMPLRKKQSTDSFDAPAIRSKPLIWTAERSFFSPLQRNDAFKRVSALLAEKGRQFTEADEANTTFVVDGKWLIEVMSFDTIGRESMTYIKSNPSMSISASETERIAKEVATAVESTG